MSNDFNILTSSLKYDDEVLDKGEEPEKFTGDIKKYRFHTSGGDIPIRSLIEQVKEGEIKIPNLQRNYVWNLKTASRFIESVLLDLPLPSIFLAKQKDKTFLIVDGLQRLTALKKYCYGEPYDNNRLFKLSNSDDIDKGWRGKAFNELSEEDQRQIRNKSLHAIIIEPKEPNDIDGLFVIFERINTGGTQLNQQEIRNAIFQNSINEMLNDLNLGKKWRSLFGHIDPNSRMRDIEMILRFFALKNFDFSNPKSNNFIRMLNDFMGQDADDNAIQQYKIQFVNMVDFVTEKFDDTIFRTDPKNKIISQKFYATIFDAVAISIDFALRNKIELLPNHKDNFMSLLENKDFNFYIGKHTTGKQAIIGRINLACETLFGRSYETKV